MKTKRKLKKIRGGGGVISIRGSSKVADVNDVRNFLKILPVNVEEAKEIVEEEKEIERSEQGEQKNQEAGIKILTEINNTNELEPDDIIIYYKNFDLYKGIGKVISKGEDGSHPYVEVITESMTNYGRMIEPYRTKLYNINESRTHVFKLNLPGDIGEIIKSYLSLSGTDSDSTGWTSGQYWRKKPPGPRRGGRRTKRRRKKRKTRRKRKNLKKRTKSKK